MVTKTKKESGAKGKKAKIKVLNLNKETVKNLTDEESKAVKGGTTQCIASFARRGQSFVDQSTSAQITTGRSYAGQSINSSGGFNP